MTEAKVPVRLEWDKPFPVQTWNEYIRGKQPLWMYNPNPMVYFNDGTVRRVQAEDLSELLDKCQRK